MTIMQNHTARKRITSFFVGTFIISSAAILYVLKQDKNSIDLGLLLTIQLFSLWIAGMNLIILNRRRL